MNIEQKILTYIKNNRVSTTEVADALGKTGALPRILPVSNGMYRTGKVKCVFTAFESNWAVHEQVRDVKPGEVVIIFTHQCGERAILGDLVSKFILLYQGAEAIVVQGKVRDVAALRREGFAVWSDGVSPIGCFNKPVDPYPVKEAEEIRKKYDGAIAVCDDGGVVIIEKPLLNEQMLQRLERIEMQEDIWFFCLDSLKWDTKKIVCDKAYLTETDLLAGVHIEQLKELSRPLDK